MSLLPDSSSFTDFGGNKLDYTAPVDPTYDRSAAEVNGVFCNVAEMSRSVSRGFVRFVGGSSPTLSSWDANWKGATATLPIVAHSSTGVYTITFPSTVSDESGSASHTVNIRCVKGGLEGTTFGFVNSSASANVITVDTAKISGGFAADDLSGVTICVIFW